MSQVPDGVMYAQIEQVRATQDYEPFRACLRLVGVDESSFQTAAFNSEAGCKTYFMDIALSGIWGLRSFALFRHSGFRYFRQRHQWWPWHLLDEWPDDLWVKLTYTMTTQRTDVYAYEIFSESEPTYLVLNDISVVSGRVVDEAPSNTQELFMQSQNSFDLYAFHVGQGMCSLLKGQADGVLLDVGAGTPITRAAYRTQGSSFVNDLLSEIHGLSLQVVLSHPDSDHWRLLDWDSSILSRVTAVYQPSGTKALAFKSPSIKSKVYTIGSTIFTNGPKGAVLFDVYRSQPSASDRNGECLIVETKSPGKGLFPGDYVYDRMATDSNPYIKNLATATFGAVVVPHHGDAASASVLVSPALPGATVAFFSAGTHAGYGHPTHASLTAHTAKAFCNIDNHTCTDIIKYQLF